jgi:hypothetical protein
MERCPRVEEVDSLAVWIMKFNERLTDTGFWDRANRNIYGVERH